MAFVFFEIFERTDRQTDRHTDMLIAILRTPTIIIIIIIQYLYSDLKSCKGYSGEVKMANGSI